MKIIKTIGHRVRTGPYEWVDISTTVEMDSASDAESGQVLTELDAWIDAALEDDLETAKKLAVEDSYIHDWADTQEEVRSR